jgi:serine/threonine protein kinase
MGLARSMDSPTSLADTFAGTPLAMAPELINGDQYSYKADVWSLGTLLYQMLTGELPFRGSNMEELKRNLTQGAYKIPKQIEVSV